ncbi:MAG: tetratricopeptide repeat protein, partial [Planctomycetia bacterium]|nr:tetratricopeptide repeat protein [Planctomycetia bacterium]
TTAETTGKDVSEAVETAENTVDGTDVDSDAGVKPNPDAVREKLNDALKQLKMVRLEILMEMENWEEVLKEVEELLKTSPQDMKLLQFKLSAQISLEKLAEAAETLSVMIDENPLDTQLYILRGQIYLATEKLELALEDFKQAEVVDGDAESVFELKVATLVQLKRYEEAQKEMDAQLEKDPENPALLIQVGMLQIQCENYEKALEFGQKAEKALPPLEEDSGAENHQLVYQYLANWYLMAGEHAESVTYYEKCLEIASENALVLNNLAWVLCTSPDEEVRDGKRAVELAKKAVELEPSPGYMSTLAAAYAEIGDFKMAMETINQGLKAAEGDAEMTASLEEEKASYDAGKPVRERTETYRGKKTE